MKIPTQVPERGFYYHYKHDPAGSVDNYAYEVLGAAVIVQLEKIMNEMYN